MFSGKKALKKVDDCQYTVVASHMDRGGGFYIVSNKPTKRI